MIQITLLFPYIFDVMLLAGHSLDVFHSSTTDTFYVSGGIRMANYLISQTFFSYAITLAIHAIMVSIRFIIAKIRGIPEVSRQKFDYITGYAKGATVIAFLFQFGGLVPILWVLGILFFLVQCISNRWLLMMFYKKTPKHLSEVAHGNLMDRISQICIILCPLISLVVSSWQNPNTNAAGLDYKQVILQAFSLTYLLLVIVLAIFAAVIYQIWRRKIRNRPIEDKNAPKKRDRYEHPLTNSSFVRGGI
jgi:magnesium-transporting ATPase (P-type)